MEELIKIIYQFYPKGISYFSGRYEDTEENKLFICTTSAPNSSWSNFLESCIDEFDLELIEDRTNEEPGNIIIIRTKHNTKHFILVLYISKLAKKYLYHIKRLGKDTEYNFFPDFKDTSISDWNKYPVEISKAVEKTLLLLKLHFPGYLLFEFDPYKIIEDISTQVHDIGETTVFNALFSNYLF